MIQYGNTKGSIQFLGHGCQRSGMNVTAVLQQLNCHIAVRTDFGAGQLFFSAQLQVIVNHPVMGQGKGSFPCCGPERVIIEILLGAAWVVSGYVP